MNKVPGCNLEFVREDDFVEYFIFPKIPETEILMPNESNLEQLRQILNEVLEKCNAVVKHCIQERNYIWHKDEFLLQIRTGSAQERFLNDEVKTSAEPLPPHFHGVTHFGDNSADEWFIVHLLFKITREISGCIARVIDSDGEFLLIEAAEELPKWANPDTCEQRVYISDGALHLVQNSPSNTAKLMSVALALSKIQNNTSLYRVSKEIEACINARFKEFTGPNNALHHQIVRVPVGVAALLKERPSLIAPAVRAFCERDTIDMKACRSMRYFPPEQRVRMNVCFTRCLYAMIMHNNYVPDRKIGWHLNNATNTEQYKEDLLGIKLACGFEILAAQAKDVNIVENEPAWRAYVKSLKDKGYFRDNLEGSENYKRLLADAKSFYKSNNARFRTAPVVGNEILELLRVADISGEQLRDDQNNLQPSDSDDWLNITADQLDAMLMERYGTKNIYKSNGDINAQEFTKNLTEFLDKQSNFEGIGSASDDDEDMDDTATTSSSQRKEDFKAKVKKNNSMRRACKENSILEMSKGAVPKDGDDSSFTTHVRNFLDFVIPEDKWDSNSDMSDYEDEDDLEQNIENMTNAEYNIDADIQAYMAQMDKELSKTNVGQTFGKNDVGSTKKTTTKPIDDDFDDIETFEPININVNTLKNMVDSYKSQLGGAGPVSNLFHAMGIGMSAAVDATDIGGDDKDIKESPV